MPARNIYKIYTENTFYHVYNRGVNKQPIFLDDQDYVVFLSLLKRYLDPAARAKQANGVIYPCYNDEVELVAYCLMSNHFHLFIYQHSEMGMKRLIRSVTVAYSMYFNKKYKRVGPLFQQRYKAVQISSHAQVLHITRYIHLNPVKYEQYKWSSYQSYIGKRYNRWLTTYRVLELFNNNPKQYAAFVADYKDKHDELEALKKEFAG